MRHSAYAVHACMPSPCVLEGHAPRGARRQASRCFQQLRLASVQPRLSRLCALTWRPAQVQTRLVPFLRAPPLVQLLPAPPLASPAQLPPALPLLLWAHAPAGVAAAPPQRCMPRTCSPHARRRSKPGRSRQPPGLGHVRPCIARSCMGSWGWWEGFWRGRSALRHCTCMHCSHACVWPSCVPARPCHQLEILSPRLSYPAALPRHRVPKVAQADRQGHSTSLLMMRAVLAPRPGAPFCSSYSPFMWRFKLAKEGNALQPELIWSLPCCMAACRPLACCMLVGLRGCWGLLIPRRRHPAPCLQVTSVGHRRVGRGGESGRQTSSSSIVTYEFGIKGYVPCAF